MPFPRSWLLAAALGLVLPGLLLVASLWIERGGVLESLQTQEREQARQRLEALRGDWRGRVRAALEDGELGSLVLRLDEQGRPERPFFARPLSLVPETPPGEVHGVLASAHELERQGEHARAAMFFAWVADRIDEPLPARSLLAWARSLAASGEANAALRLLEERVQREDPRTDAGMPLEVLATLLALEIDAERGEERAAVARLDELLDGRPPVPIFMARGLAGFLMQKLDASHGPRLQSFAAAGRIAQRLEDGEQLEPGEWWGEGAHLCLRTGPRELSVFSKERAAVLFEQWRGRLPTSDFDLSIGPSERPALAVWHSPLFEQPVALAASPGIASRRLERFARALLWSAVLAFVLGNWWLLGLVRKELRVARLKQDFVDLVSHELRTPLTAISLRSEMLAKGDVPWPRQREYLGALYSDVRRLGTLVERILDFARLSKGRVPLTRSRISARSLLAKALLAGRPALRLAAQQVRLVVPRVLPDVEVDAELLTRALRNLLENASKYAPAGSTVHVEARADSGELVIRVRDEGSGLERSQLQEVFEPFKRGRGAATQPGTGLGLAVVAQAVRAHGGEVKAANAEGGGAVFELRLPAGTEDAA